MKREHGASEVKQEVKEVKTAVRVRAPSRLNPSRDSSPEAEPVGAIASTTDCELQRWREFGSVMAAQYEELKEKHAEVARQRSSDQRTIDMLREQVKEQQQSAQTHIAALQGELATAQARIAALESQVAETRAQPRLPDLAAQVIQLRTELDKALAELSRAKRRSLNDSLTGLVLRNSKLDLSRRSSRSSLDNM